MSSGDSPAESQNLESDGSNPSSATEAQLRKLGVLLRAAGIEDRHAHLSELVGRAIGSTRELSKSEASSAIDELGKQEAER